MRHAPAWMAAIGVLAGLFGSPTQASAASVWVTLAAGVAGSGAPTSSSDFSFNSQGQPQVAVTQLSGGVTATATTGGGFSFFGGVGTPVLLDLGNGSAYISGGSPPASATTAGAAGGTPTSSAPVAGAAVPSNAALLGINVADPANGKRTLTASITDGSGHSLGSGAIAIPDGGWWVLGLSPTGAPSSQTPSLPSPPTQVVPPSPPDNLGPPVAPPLPPPPPSPPAVGHDSKSNGSGPITTPEPMTFALALFGGIAAHVWRRRCA